MIPTLRSRWSQIDPVQLSVDDGLQGAGASRAAMMPPEDPAGNPISWDENNEGSPYKAMGKSSKKVC